MKIHNIKEALNIFTDLFKGYWQSEEKWQARGLLSIVIVLNLTSVYLMIKITDWYNEFYTIMQNYSYDKFFHSIGKFSIIAFLLIFLAVYSLYLQQMLQIKWRTWLTKNYLSKWMYKQVYYRLQTDEASPDNPDQRIQEDINLFVSLTLSLGIGLFKQITIFLSFVGLLWLLSGTVTFSLNGHNISISGFMVWVTLIYSIIGTFITHKVGHQLINLNFNQQKLEADFRFSLIRVLENSECIAFYKGENSENNSFMLRFKNIIYNFKSIMNRQKILTGMTVSYSQLAIIIPMLIAAPRYFNETLPLGWFIQVLSVFGRIQDSLSYLVNSYTDIAQWLSVIRRLHSFNQKMEQTAQINSAVTTIPANALSAKELSIFLPDGKPVIKDLNLTLNAQESLIITGPSGSGKSTLLRTLAQIWPFCSGKLYIPKQNEILFLPQKPYIPLGTLRQALYYPQIQPRINIDKDLSTILSMCKLDKFIAKLDSLNNWSKILSLGEQQKLAFARILIKRPYWVFMDESTSALDEHIEEYLYVMLKKNIPYITIISIGHRSTLMKFHKYKLTINDNTTYDLSLVNQA
ncbi:ABC transporter ATP-binding protein/permease [Pectinatus sottacetonis]|uniref:ABC transporter ATP-binding protein/permease n=1 Tax=Pectinatus sottacetonis TaxID=1002795 RepID=UPI0018C621D8|nr:ABC transporter ATP-binding protein/permease [Pectinatus sottacetonis]